MTASGITLYGDGAAKGRARYIGAEAVDVDSPALDDEAIVAQPWILYAEREGDGVEWLKFVQLGRDTMTDPRLDVVVLEVHTDDLPDHAKKALRRLKSANADGAMGYIDGGDISRFVYDAAEAGEADMADDALADDRYTRFVLYSGES